MRISFAVWTAVDFVFTAGRLRYKRINEFDGEISIKDTNDEYQVVDRFDINRAREGLGIFVTPNGFMDMQLTEILKK